MICGGIVRLIRPAKTQRRPHAGGTRRIQLRRDVGNEAHVLR